MKGSKTPVPDCQHSTIILIEMFILNGMMQLMLSRRNKYFFQPWPICNFNVCKCIGGDESCFANIIGFAQDGELEDALLLASNLVAPKFASYLVASARKFAGSITISECNPLEAEEIYYQSYSLH